jgi:uncharacterized protein YjaG (DUF416 family)
MKPGSVTLEEHRIFWPKNKMLFLKRLKCFKFITFIWALSDYYFASYDLFCNASFWGKLRKNTNSLSRARGV